MGIRTSGPALFWTIVLAGAAFAAPRPCAAEDAAGPPAWLEEITFNGFLSSSYSYNLNHPATRTNQLRVFDFDDNTFKLDEFELVAQRAVAKPRDTGFRADLTFGSSVPRVAASAGLFRDASGAAQDIDLHQVFASYIAPLGAGLRLDAGKFITGHGYEVIDGYDGWNDNATRSFLFGYAIPFTHVGVRATYAFSPRASAMLMLVNGWDVARDNNRSKSAGAQITLVPLSPVTLIVSGMTGPERATNDGDHRELLDVVVIVKAHRRITLGANLDWGTEDSALGPGRDAGWNGAAGYLRAMVSEAFAVSLRGEVFKDRDGTRTNLAQKLSEITVTPELRLSPHLLVRGDLRADASNHPVFEKSQDFSKTQRTALIGAIYSF